jgi:hypothetical protein
MQSSLRLREQSEFQMVLETPPYSFSCIHLRLRVELERNLGL